MVRITRHENVKVVFDTYLRCKLVDLHQTKVQMSPRLFDTLSNISTAKLHIFRDICLTVRLSHPTHVCRIVPLSACWYLLGIIFSGWIWLQTVECRV